MKKKYIVWDFDGTLVNTNDIIIESWQATLRKFLGRELPVREIEATFGEVLADSIRKLIPGVDVDEAIQYYRHFQDTHHEEIPVYVFEGVRELLEELRRRGCLIGVGTSRTAYSFWNYMKELGMEDAVDEVVTVNDVTAHKPDPETVNTVLLRLMMHDADDTSEAEERRAAALAEGRESTDYKGNGLPEEICIPDAVRREAVMIGDAKYDIGCAQNAGIDSVLVGWSHYVDEEDMAASGFTPTYRIQTPAELLTII